MGVMQARTMGGEVVEGGNVYGEGGLFTFARGASALCPPPITSGRNFQGPTR